MTTPAHFLGRGWGFDASSGVHVENGTIVEASGEAKIRQSLLLILSTAQGERIGRPTFGCGIHDLVFSPRSPATLARIAESVRAAINAWEPRVDVLDIAVRPEPTDPRGLLILIHYQVRATNSRANMVYPFYLST